MADRSFIDILNEELSDANRDSDDDFSDLSGNSSDSEFVPSDSETSEEEGNEIVTSSNDTDTQSDTEVGEDVGTQANAFVEGPFRAKDGTEWNRIPPQSNQSWTSQYCEGPSWNFSKYGRFGISLWNFVTRNISCPECLSMNCKLLKTTASLLQHIYA